MTGLVFRELQNTLLFIVDWNYSARILTKKQAILVPLRVYGGGGSPSRLTAKTTKSERSVTRLRCRAALGAKKIVWVAI